MTLFRKTRFRCACGYTYAGDSRRRKCPECGATRKPKHRAKHLKALDLDYQAYIELNGGERCGVCGVGPSANRRLDRDHDHATGRPRGLLCHRHNRNLGPRMGWTVESLLAAAAYLARPQGGNQSPDAGLNQDAA